MSQMHTKPNPHPRISPEQRRRNTQLGLILASVALAFMVGFVVKMTWL